jgi:Kef-type K+ transport system membrane component KefB
VTDTQAGILLLDLALIVLLAQAFGYLAALLGQPRVVGEIVAGILVGPTLLGGTVSATIFPLDVRPFLAAVADLGLVMFMLVVGMELHRPVLRGAARITSGAVLGALIVPLGLGAVLGLYLAGQYRAVHRVGLVMFIAVAMAVTAFPVLARIIADRGLSRTGLGAVALSAAAICDVVAWTLLAGVEALTGGAAPWRLVLLVPYVAVMFFLVRPGLRWLLRDGQVAAVRAGRLALIVVGLLASAAATQLLGLHFVFGAFLFGLVMPARETSRQSASVMNHMQLGTVALLPVYFVIAGLQVDLSHIGIRGLAQLGLIIAVAVIGKFGGTFVGVRTTGLPTRQSAALGTLMNARGLTELVVLSVGLALGEINQRLYSLMVVMAVVTTVMTGPVLRLLLGADAPEYRHEQPSEQEKPSVSPI